MRSEVFTAAPPRAAIRGLTVLAILSAIFVAGPSRSDTVTNPLSQFPISNDGQFTDGVGTGEWSDVTPLAFHSPTATGDTFRATHVGDADTNTLLFASLAAEEPGGDEPDDGLYLMYDYLPRTNPSFAPGGFIADISFPVVLGGQEKVITVQVRGAAKPGGPSFFEVFVDLNQDGIPDTTAAALGMEAGVGFGPSPLSPVPHLLVELEVPLRIPENFGTGFPQNGINPATGLYDPDPQFWSGGFAKNDADPPGSSALFRINPDASVTCTNNLIVTRLVNCDVKPEGTPNSINLKSKGVVPVALLSTAGFDAQTIVASSVWIGDESLTGCAFAVKSHMEDVNGDGRPDLVLHFRTQDLVSAGFNTSSTTAVLAGKLTTGEMFGATDQVRIVR